MERVRTAHLPRPSSAIGVRDADPRLLGVHATIAVDGQEGDLPRYVPRDGDDTIHRILVPGPGAEVRHWVAANKAWYLMRAAFSYAIV